MNDIKLDTIDQAIDEIKNGKVIVVVDDEDRKTKVISSAQRNVLHRKL